MVVSQYFLKIQNRKGAGGSGRFDLPCNPPQSVQDGPRPLCPCLFSSYFNFGSLKLDLYIAASLCKFRWVEKCRKRLHTQHIANGFLESGGREYLMIYRRPGFLARRTIWLLPSPVNQQSLFSVILSFADFAF